MNVKDVISAVVTSMKPTFTGLTIIANAGSPYLITGFSSTRLLYVGEKLRIIGTNPVVSSLCTITEITSTTVTVTTSDTLTVGHTNNTAATATPILVFDHGHPLEIINRVKEYQESDTLKYEAFPRICLLHDFEEKNTFETLVSLTILIITDTDPNYTAPQRYTYTLDPILLPLYDLFLENLLEADHVGTTEGNYFKHTKIDRLYWGKNGLYGNQGNIFNDYIDAVEIKDLELIIQNC